jgi:hypothetical protein
MLPHTLSLYCAHDRVRSGLFLFRHGCTYSLRLRRDEIHACSHACSGTGPPTPRYATPIVTRLVTIRTYAVWLPLCARTFDCQVSESLSLPYIYIFHLFFSFLETTKRIQQPLSGTLQGTTTTTHSYSEKKMNDSLRASGRRTYIAVSKSTTLK